MEGGGGGEARLEAGESMRQVTQQHRQGKMVFRATRVMVKIKSKKTKYIWEV